MSVKIITDSPADIPVSDAKALGIHAVVPIHVNVNGVDHLDGVTITPKEFFKMIDTSDRLAITSQASPAKFQEVFAEAIADGSEIVVVLLSRFLSGMVQSATIARDMFTEEESARIHIVDTETYTLSEAALVYYALRLRDEGKAASEIKDRLDEIKGKVRFYVAIGDLKFLRMGGRIWGPGAAVGEMLSVKPIVTCKGGQVTVAHASLGMQKACDWIAKTLKKSDVDYSMPFAIGHAGGEQLIEKFSAQIETIVDFTKFSDLITYEVGVSVGTHSGPNCVGIAYFDK